MSTFRIYKLTVASLKMFLRNRQALFFSLFMPVLILVIFGSINFDGGSTIKLGIAVQKPSAMTDEFLKRLRENPALEITTGDLAGELDQLKQGNRAAVVELPDGIETGLAAGQPATLKVHVNQGKMFEAHQIIGMMRLFVDEATLQIANVKPLLTIEQEDVSVRNLRNIDFLLPGIIAMSIMQMSTFSVAFVFARYKEQGILRRLQVTPMRPFEFVTASIITRLIMAVSQAALFVGMGMAFYHVQVLGPLWLLAICVVLGSLMFLGLGFTISGLSKNTESVPVISNLVVFPMLFLGNVFFNIDSMPPWLLAIAKFLPLTYLASSVRGVMIQGDGAQDIATDLLGMSIWAILLIGAATVVFRFQDRESA